MRKVRRACALVAILAVAALAGCGVAWTEPEDVDCPPGGTPYSWESFGKGFMARWCNDCHGAATDDRNGAPVAYVFDTYDQVHALRERIFVRAAGDNTSMPPGPDDPPREERDKLAEWLACGAPEHAQ